MNGGFAGANVVTEELPKFKGKKFVRTFNFNADVNAVDKILKMNDRHYLALYLIGKNVCHNPKNTENCIWKNESNIIKECGCNSTKLQHDMLACHEGLAILYSKGLIEYNVGNSFCLYDYLSPIAENGLNGTMTKWGSTDNESQYRKCFVAVEWR